MDGARPLESLRQPELTQLEQSLASYCGTKFALGVSSGTDALLLALMALDVKPGDEIVTSTYSFFATAGVVARLGAKPVFVDIDLATFNIDPKLLEKAITKKTKALIPVHLFGQSADMKSILEIAKRHRVPVLEDAAQSLGAECWDGRKTGSVGEIGATSFFPTKNLGGIGDAGAVFTSDAALNEKMKLLRVHGAKDRYYHEMVGGNFRLDSIQAAVLNIKFKHLEAWTEQRRQAAARYEKLFKASGLLEKPGIILPSVGKAVGTKARTHVYNQYVILTPKRDALREALGKNGIPTQVYYPVPLHLQSCFSSSGYKKGDCPNAERASVESLALPIYPEIAESQQQAVVEGIQKFFLFA